MQALFCWIVQVVEGDWIDDLTDGELLDFFISVELEANAGKAVLDLVVIAEV